MMKILKIYVVNYRLIILIKYIKKHLFLLEKKNLNYITKKVQKPFKKELICLIDFTIINEKIYELLKNDLNYIKAEIYKIDNTKYIILIKNLFQEYLNEIGYLHGNNNFVPEYIFNYKYQKFCRS